MQTGEHPAHRTALVPPEFQNKIFEIAAIARYWSPFFTSVTMLSLRPPAAEAIQLSEILSSKKCFKYLKIDI